MRVVGVAVFVALTFAVTLYLRSGGQTVKIEIDDSLKAAQDVAVSIDGKTISIAEIGETISLKAGPHLLEIKRGDVVVQSDNFTIVKGARNLLIVSLTGNTPGTPTPSGRPIAVNIGGPSPLDDFRRSAIVPYELKAAGFGDPAQALGLTHISSWPAVPVFRVREGRLPSMDRLQRL